MLPESGDRDAVPETETRRGDGSGQGGHRGTGGRPAGPAGGRCSPAPPHGRTAPGCPSAPGAAAGRRVTLPLAKTPSRGDHLAGEMQGCRCGAEESEHGTWERRHPHTLKQKLRSRACENRAPQTRGPSPRPSQVSRRSGGPDPDATALKTHGSVSKRAGSESATRSGGANRRGAWGRVVAGASDSDPAALRRAHLAGSCGQERRPLRPDWPGGRLLHVSLQQALRPQAGQLSKPRDAPAGATRGNDAIDDFPGCLWPEANTASPGRSPYQFERGSDAAPALQGAQFARGRS